MYTFDESIVSDLYKDAYGFRPRELFWSAWNEASDEDKQGMWDVLLADLNASIEFEKAEKARSVTDFEAEVMKYIGYGAADRSTALRWMTQDADFRDEQDVEHWVWQRGLMFTDLEKSLTAEIKAMYGIAY